MIRFGKIYDALLAAYGSQNWWPGQDEFEVIVGALLVQRTSWRNVEIALAKLSHEGLLSPRAMSQANTATIERCIRSAGFFRSKAERLKGIAAFFAESAPIAELRSSSDRELRQALLALDGVGPETADSILLYAFARPAVVVDAYLRRLSQRLLARSAPIPDDDLREWVRQELPDVPRLNELHALVVAHGKSVCGSDPECFECKLRTYCRVGSARSDS